MAPTVYEIPPQINHCRPAGDMLAANDLKANIQAISNFYSATSGGYIHAEVEFLEEEQREGDTEMINPEGKTIDE